MLDSQEITPPLKPAFNFELEFGENSQTKILNSVNRYSNSIDLMSAGPIILGDFEIISKILTGKSFLDQSGKERVLKELKDQWGYIEAKIEPIEPLDKFFISWSHYLIGGDHLANPDELISLQQKGKKTAQDTIKKLTKKEALSPVDLRNLSSAVLFLSIGGQPNEVDPTDLSFLKSLLLRNFEKVEFPNTYMLEDQVDILHAYADYVLANTKDIKYLDHDKQS